MVKADPGKEISLDRGLYTVRVEVNGKTEEKLVRLSQDVDLSGLAPARYTPAPVLGSAITHEYYSYTA